MLEYMYTPVTVEDERAVVGGASGVGQAIALGFVSEVTDVIATSRSEGAVKETTAAIEDDSTRRRGSPATSQNETRLIKCGSVRGENLGDSTLLWPRKARSHETLSLRLTTKRETARPTLRSMACAGSPSLPSD